MCSQLRSAVAEGLVSQKAALKFIGQRFRHKTDHLDQVSDEVVTKDLLRCATCMCACINVLCEVELFCDDIIHTLTDSI